ncbi:molybdate ABC transporter permease subunit [Salinivibrio sp. ML290]|uniref:molybdate ABC transporter permease subunit n=1 Tax=Salinivibrio sp. ML290 TaxID=1909468 RepID=UPI0009883918|nr:molybdate ABC transporter permease subunit [Salinivibrio sp. ML290]OOE72276.1 molybdenum ABC transporter permease subunit [Salinivibrio sp. ML290]
MISPNDVTALFITLKLAFVSTSILLVICTPLAWWIVNTRTRVKVFIEALVMLPLVLPPTVLGFYLLLLLGPNGWIGGSLEALGFNHLAFSFSGIVVGSMIYSLPFVMQPLLSSFQSATGSVLDVAATLRASPIDRFFNVVLPLSRRGFLTAGVLSFAHSLGEFGIIIMIGGNIPGQTQLASIAIYNHVESMNYAAAHTLAAILVSLSFILLLATYTMNKKFKPVSFL